MFSAVASTFECVGPTCTQKLQLWYGVGKREPKLGPQHPFIIHASNVGTVAPTNIIGASPTKDYWVTLQ